MFSEGSAQVSGLEEERPFHYEWWFPVIVALGAVVVILVIISLLCLAARNKKGMYCSFQLKKLANNQKGILVLIQESTKFNELAKINQYISTSVFKNHEI